MRIIATCLLLMIAGFNGFAQKDSVTIRGTITDSLSKEIMIFVDVVFDSVDCRMSKRVYYTRTNIDGMFQLKVPRSVYEKANYKLYFNYVGYEIRPVSMYKQSPKKPVKVTAKRSGITLEHNDPVEFQEPLIDK